MGEAKRRNSNEALLAEVLALREANIGLRQAVREREVRLLRQGAQYQEALAKAEASVVELRVALAGHLAREAAAAEKGLGLPAAGQVAAGAKQG